MKFFIKSNSNNIETFNKTLYSFYVENDNFIII